MILDPVSDIQDVLPSMEAPDSFQGLTADQEEAALFLSEARTQLLSFAQAVDSRYMAGWHHEVIAAKLEQAFRNVQEGKKTRIILSVPPRHGKSELATIKFPAWALGKDPSIPFIVTSYGADLAEDFGLKTRDLINSPAYRAIFPTRLRKDTRAKGRWLVRTEGQDGIMEEAHGSYTAVGVGGAITGRGAKIAIIDDPLKNRQDAESAVMRKTVWDWYTSTLYTRLEGFGAVILIMTRWHMDDLAGQLMAHSQKLRDSGESYDDWEVIEFPAIADVDEPHRKAGDPLWPEKFTIENLQAIKKQVGIYDWAALYQQNPVLSETQEFKKDSFRYYEQSDLRLMDLRYYTLVDPAISQKRNADNTVVLTVAKEVNGPRIFRIREDAGKFTPSQTVDLIFMHQHDYRSEVWIETVAYQAALKFAVEEEQRRKQSYFVINEIRTKAPKEVKIRGLLPLYQAGVIYHLASDFDYELEALQFPRGRHDDRLDCMAMSLEAVQTTGRGKYASQFKPKWAGYGKKSR